jgi:hypothetical protein
MVVVEFNEKEAKSFKQHELTKSQRESVDNIKKSEGSVWWF